MSIVWGMFILCTGIVLGSIILYRASLAEKKQFGIIASCGMTGGAVAVELLTRHGYDMVRIEQEPMIMADHYDPEQNILRLSGMTIDSPSVAALSIVAHECGHVMQKYTDCFWIKLRCLKMLPLRMSADIGWLFLLASGIWFSQKLFAVGIVILGLSLFAVLLRMPMELDANKRGIRMLINGCYLNNKELQGAKNLLDSLALTNILPIFADILKITLANRMVNQIVEKKMKQLHCQ